MTRKFNRAAITIFAVVGCVVAGCFDDPRADRVSREDRRIMRTMVNISCELEVESLVISDRPAVPPQDDLQDIDGRSVQFRIQLQQRIARNARWPTGEICPVVRVVADSRIESVLERDTRSWDLFIATFDGAKSLMRISLPVYSSDGKRAVVYTTGTCPYTCGAGFYHELEKTRSGWRITRSVNAWRS